MHVSSRTDFYGALFQTFSQRSFDVCLSHPLLRLCSYYNFNPERVPLQLSYVVGLAAHAPRVVCIITFSEIKNWIKKKSLRKSLKESLHLEKHHNKHGEESMNVANRKLIRWMLSWIRCKRVPRIDAVICLHDTDSEKRTIRIALKSMRIKYNNSP